MKKTTYLNHVELQYECIILTIFGSTLLFINDIKTSVDIEIAFFFYLFLFCGNIFYLFENFSNPVFLQNYMFPEIVYHLGLEIFVKTVWLIQLWCTALISLMYFCGCIIIILHACTFSGAILITWEIKQTYLSILNLLVSKIPVEALDLTQANKACKTKLETEVQKLELSLPYLW